MIEVDLAQSTGPRVAIMQPYFLPYIGYFQLMQAVDVFVVYDNIKYTKKGWINRNRLLLNGHPAVFSLPLQRGSDSLEVREREIAPEFDPHKLMAQIEGAYRRAPFFEAALPVIRDIVEVPTRSLFDYLFHSIVRLKEHLGLETSLRVSSHLDVDHSLRSQDRVLSICKALQARCYLNAPGGAALYESAAFEAAGLELAFIVPNLRPYEQFGGAFVPALSIVDVLMFNPLERIRDELLTAHAIAGS